MAPAPPALAFGPVPSRRLGQSLGVNNIPSKHCSYSCVYCQVGRTTSMEADRRTFYPAQEVASAVEGRVAACRASGQRIDYVTFVPEGEPTLDLHLGEEIRAVRTLGIPVAVITNGSLLWRPDVRAELDAADLVSVKVDAVDERTWRRVCRPSRALDLAAVLDGVRRFAADYRGRLLTETMLVRGLNDGHAAVERIARVLETVRPDVAYLAVPTRPPAESDTQPPGEQAVVAAYQTLSTRLPRVELLTGDTEGDFGGTGDSADDLLGILAVHPMLETAAREYLERNRAMPAVLDALLTDGLVVRVQHRGHVFVLRARARDPRHR